MAVTPERADPSAQGAPVLVVDLDGTLLASDMLFESFWSAWARDWRTPLAALGGLAGGRAGVKAAVARLASVDVATLPYDPQVIDYARRWRAEGGRAVLVTATDQTLAQQVADHLDLFDEVRGTADGVNLKGPNKAAWLVGRYGEGGFRYVGDSPADLPVWARAAGAVAVNPSDRLSRRIEAVSPGAERLDTGRRAGLSFAPLRPHQWLKNLLVFVPMLAAHRLDAPTFGQSLLAFAAFCLVASGVYVLNDLLDLGPDRRHSRKRLRAFASGAVSLRTGTALFPVLLLAGLGLAALGGMALFGVMLAYLVLTTAYSLWLKRLIVIDICVLACVYTMRIIAGGTATGIEISVWLFTFSIFLFLSLAAVKRQAELVAGVRSGAVKTDGRGYHVDDLAVVATMAIAAGYVSVLVLSLYLNSTAVVGLYPRPEVLWGVVPVLLFWVSRMTMTAHRGEMHDDPMIFAATDRASQVCVALVAGLALAGALWP
jgi:4-hydroxybenzoate polyprenyltransferase/phosphoserine phosphatase